MLSGLQIKMARIAVGWDAAQLAGASGVALTTVSRIENGGGVYASTLAKLQEALEGAGAVFIADRQASPDGGPGVRLGAGGMGVAKLASKPTKRPVGKSKSATRKSRGK